MRLPHLRELERDEEEQADLGREGLRGRDADLQPGARVEDRVDLARDLRAHHVRDRDGARAHLAGELHRGDRVARLARLRDPDHERAPVEHGIAVDPLRRDVVLDGYARPLLDRVAARDGSVVRRAGGEDHDAAQHPQRGVVDAEPVELEPAVAHAIADRLGDGFGLLVDLLQHERLEARLLGALVVPVELDELALDRAAVLGPQERGAVARDRDEVAVLGEVHLARLAQERGRVRGEERLAAADADHERALMPRADEEPGMVAVDRRRTRNGPRAR